MMKQLTDVNSAKDIPTIQILPPVQNLMTRTVVNSIDDPKKKKLEVESSRRIEGTDERVGLRHEANSDLTEGEKKIMQSAQVAANHNDEGSKVADSGSKM